MIMKQQVQIEGRCYPVVISDEKEALLAAQAAGKAMIGYLHEGGEQDLSPARYLVESLEVLQAPGGAAQHYLEQVTCRQFGIPWKITETDCLCIREFTLEDIAHVPQEPQDQEADRVFYTPERLMVYIQNQYAFYEYGIWAIVRKADGVLLGKAGVSSLDGAVFGKEDLQLELGYHIFQPYRHQGYAVAACKAILDYVKAEWDCPVYAVVEEDNAVSLHVLKKLNFQFKMQKCIPTGQSQYLYEWNC